MTQNQSVQVREIPERVREAMAGLGVPPDEIPVVVPVDAFDRAVLLTQYRLFDLSMPPPYVHRVISIPWSHEHASLAAVLTAALASSRLSRTALFQLTYGTGTAEVCLDEILVRPTLPTECKIQISSPL